MHVSSTREEARGEGHVSSRGKGWDKQKTHLSHLPLSPLNSLSRAVSAFMLPCLERWNSPHHSTRSFLDLPDLRA